MKIISQFRSAACFAALVAGNAAFADVTAQEVWDNWKAQMALYGQNGITIGSEEYAGGVLTVTDMGINIDDGATTVSANMANITFTENGDGTVTVTYSEEYPITIGDSTDLANNRATILFKTTGNQMVVSGTPAEMNYDLKADRYTITVTEALEDGQPVPVEANLNFNDIGGSYMVATDDTLRNMTYNLTAVSLDLLLAGEDAGQTFDMSGQVSQLAMAGAMSMPVNYDAATPETMFADGFAVQGDYSTGQGTFVINANDDMGPTSITSTNASSMMSVAMDKDSMSFGIDQKGLAMNVMTPQAPFPVDLTATQIGLSMAMPMSKTEEPTDFSAKLDLVEVNTNDMIWSMADPANALPHDPITAQVDLTGTGKLYFDLTNPEDSAQMDAGAVPGELNSLTLNALNLVLAGATVTGTGDFTFDNADLVSFGGMPAPIGSLELQGKGINALLDKLQGMGLIPEDQMMGARMMLGMFATVTGDDELTSKIETQAGGSVFINGQQIK